MGKTHKRRIKVSEIVVSENATIGNVKFNGKKPEPHERRTIDFLSILGYDVETIIPSNVPGSRNPDILMMGTFWEMKGPISAESGDMKRIIIIKNDKIALDIMK